MTNEPAAERNKKIQDDESECHRIVDPSQYLREVRPSADFSTDCGFDTMGLYIQCFPGITGGSAETQSRLNSEGTLDERPDFLRDPNKGMQTFSHRPNHLSICVSQNILMSEVP
jgi:hypothetical protein